MALLACSIHLKNRFEVMGREEREGEREREEERQGMRYVTFCDAVAPMALWKRKSLAREDFTTSEGAHR